MNNRIDYDYMDDTVDLFSFLKPAETGLLAELFRMPESLIPVEKDLMPYLENETKLPNETGQKSETGSLWLEDTDNFKQALQSVIDGLIF